jgi:hypothetical protein
VHLWEGAMGKELREVHQSNTDFTDNR